jgi:hypothetical protein
MGSHGVGIGMGRTAWGRMGMNLQGPYRPLALFWEELQATRGGMAMTKSLSP